MLLSTLGRLIWVPIAFVISALVSVIVLVTLGLERITQAMHGREADLASVSAVLDLLRQAHMLTAGLTIVPAILLVIVGEVARIRSSLYYLIGGGLALAAVPLIARLGQGGMAAATMPSAMVWQVFATAGFLGGWVYWMLAGRNA